MVSHSDLPFIVTAALLVLWGSGKSDSNVTFLGVTFACAYTLVHALLASAVNRTVVFPSDVVPSTDYFSGLFEQGDEKTLGYFVLSLFCFGFGAVGTTTFALSPFLGTVLYSVVVSALFRDASIVGDVRIIVGICVIISGALSEHVFRLNVVALMIACIIWENKIEFPQRGAMESVCFINGLIFLTIHDLVVRFLLGPIKAIIEAGFFGMTAHVIVDSALMLGALPARPLRAWDPENPDLLRIRWSDCLNSNSTPFDKDFPRRLALASPILSSLFCMSYFFRMLRSNKRDLDWTRWQQIFGVGFGTALGLQLWSRYSLSDAIKITSPITVAWVSTSLLVYSSVILNGSVQIGSKRDVWHQVYWRGAPFGRKKVSENQKPKQNNKREGTPYPTLLLASFSATYPEIHEIAWALESDYFSLENNTAKLRALSDRSKPIEYAKQTFACAQLVSTLLKYSEDLIGKLDSRVDILAREAQVFTVAPGEGPQTASKVKQRIQLLQQEGVAIRSYSDLLQREQNKRDDEALSALEAALKIVSARPSATSAAEELEIKQEADVLDSMCEAVRRRIKHRKKRDETQQASLSKGTLEEGSIVNAQAVGADRATLPVIPADQSSLFPSERDAASKDGISPSKKKGFLSRLLRSSSKKKVVEGASIEGSDRQSAGSATSSGKRWLGSGKKKSTAS